jgi:flagellar biosynthesis/type III secretory pathway protein FliH
MLSKARRLTQGADVVPLSWADLAAQPAHAERSPFDAVAAGSASSALQPNGDQDGFAQGYAQGERAGAAATSAENEALHRRLTGTLDELVDLRARVVRQAERDMIQLALAIARRVALREVSLDRELLVAMARVALDRLAEASRVTIRVHPADFDALSAARHGDLAGEHIDIVADSRIGRGGCRLESECGTVEASVDAQIRELGRALLGDERGEDLGGAVRDAVRDADRDEAGARDAARV